MGVKGLGILCATAIAVALAGACDSGRKSGRGLRLPDGDIKQGKLAFVELGCPSCHEVAGVEAVIRV
jgi:transposase